MGLFGKHGQVPIANPARGRLQVVACSPFPDAGGETILRPKCDIDGVITAERVSPVAIHFSGYGVPKPKWPCPGMMLPVTLDLADPKRFRIEWDEVPTGPQAAAELAEALRGESSAPEPPFPRVWREAEHAAASPKLANGLTPQQTEIALAGGGAALGLVPATAEVLAAREAGPSSAPGGTWDITVRVAAPDGGPGWDAVTRMSFSSPERRKRRTATGRELPVLIDPNDHRRILVDVSRLL